jgi:hypothetical protein
VLQQIENDKLERAARAGKLPSQAGSAAAKPGLSPSATIASPRSSGGGNVARLCFRLQDGTSLKEQFEMKQTYIAILPLQLFCPFVDFYLIACAASATYSNGWTVECLQGTNPNTQFLIPFPPPPIHFTLFPGSTPLFATCPPHPIRAVTPQRSRLQVSRTQCIPSLLTTLFRRCKLSSPFYSSLDSNPRHHDCFCRPYPLRRSQRRIRLWPRHRAFASRGRQRAQPSWRRRRRELAIVDNQNGIDSDHAAISSCRHAFGPRAEVRTSAADCCCCHVWRRHRSGWRRSARCSKARSTGRVLQR